MRKNRRIMIVIIVLLLLSSIFIILQSSYKVFISESRVSCKNLITDDSAVIMVINPRMPYASNIIATLTGYPALLLKMILPYELALIFDVNKDLALKRAKMMVSPRRLRPVIANMSKKFADDVIVNKMRFSMNSVVDKEGALRIHAKDSISKESLDVIRKYQSTKELLPLSPEGDHLLEVTLDNRYGGVFLVFESFFLLQKNSDEKGSPGEEKQQIFDADQLSGLFYRIATARITIDPKDEESLIIKINIVCPDAVTRDQTMFALLTSSDALFKKLIQMGLILEGEPVVDGNSIKVEYSLNGIMNLFKKEANDVQTQ